MILKYIRTKQVYNLRIKDSKDPNWVYITDAEIRKFSTHSEFEGLIDNGSIQSHPIKRNTYSTDIIGGYDLSLLDFPFYQEPLYNAMFDNLLLVGLPDSLNNEKNKNLFWFSTFMTYRNVIKSLFFTVDDFSGRIHTPVTNLKKEYRKQLLLNGEAVKRFDVKTMAPMLLAKVLHDHIGKNDYSDYLFAGHDIYLLIKDKFSLKGRDEAKSFILELLFSKPNRKLNNLFPTKEWLVFINEFKGLEIPLNPSNRRKPYTNLAWLLQSYEVKLMKRVWSRLVEDEIPFLTVHDEIIVPESMELDAYMIMHEELEKDIPQLKICVS